MLLRDDMEVPAL
ncbi:hypothetical protein CGLO_17271 [Colletotrichum gloeosporioides Cg-14]|uniref:Uncharacterized protein n=1 Tax=Colletotrichum gloeosporioides (strain Cg-14) TaxID=1237896 RepID=T0L717_COLGC|nr:hypothetical protein CGLO_17271 [Colletotrichum gloeosporioides Cg-14]